MIQKTLISIWLKHQSYLENFQGYNWYKPDHYQGLGPCRNSSEAQKRRSPVKNGSAEEGQMQKLRKIQRRDDTNLHAVIIELGGRP